VTTITPQSHPQFQMPDNNIMQ